MSDRGVFAVAAGAPGLECLDAGGANLTDDALDALAALPRLHTLSVAYVGVLNKSIS